MSGKGRKRKATSKEGPAEKLQNKLEWCADCWAAASHPCSLGHRLLETKAALAEATSGLSEVCGEMERLEAKLKQRQARVEAVRRLLEERSPTLQIDVESCESYGHVLEGGLIKIAVAADVANDEAQVLCRTWEGEVVWYEDEDNGALPGTFSAGMPQSLFKKLPDQPKGVPVSKGTVLVSNRDGKYEFKIYTSEVKSALKRKMKVFGRVTHNLKAVDLGTAAHCDDDQERGAGLLQNVQFLP